MKIDASTDKGKRVLKKLEEELVIWLATAADGRPQSVPVWFLWEDGTLLVYSVPGKKVEDIRANPNVHLNFNSTRSGGEVVRFQARADVLEGHPLATTNKAYMRKYDEQVRRIGWTPDEFAGQYHVAIRITPDRLKTG